MRKRKRILRGRKRDLKKVEMKVLTVLVIAVVSYIIFVGISPFAFTGFLAKTKSSLLAIENLQEKTVNGICLVDFSVILSNKENKNLEDVYLILESYNTGLEGIVDQKVINLETVYGDSRVGWNDRLEVTCEKNDDSIVARLVSFDVTDEVYTDSVY